MKATGIVRQIDELGRVVLPKELRRTLSIDERDPLEIFVEGERIILQKYQPGCILCGSVDGEMLRHSTGKLACRNCVESFLGK